MPKLWHDETGQLLWFDREKVVMGAAIMMVNRPYGGILNVEGGVWKRKMKVSQKRELKDNLGIDREMLVAVGILINANREVLLSFRPEGLRQGGFWEFPGGKVVEGETLLDALKREMLEELNIHVGQARPLTTVCYVYETIKVVLDCWLIEAYCGRLMAKEGQTIQLVRRDHLDRYQMARPNQTILESVKKRMD